MENIRQIIQEELAKIQVSENQSESNPFESHPYFGNPEKMYNYAMEWVDKAQKLGYFHQLVGNILWDMNSAEERIEHLRSLYKEYGKFK